MKLSLDWKNATDPVFIETALRRAALVVQTALLLLLAWSLAELSWRLWPAPGSQPPPPRAGEAAGGAQAERRGWDIARWHLFGIRPAGRAAARPVTELPETRLNLVLRGVVASEAGAVSGAIIATPGGQEAFYTVNAPLPGGAVLKEVYPDRVVLERNGRLETLRLPREALAGEGRAAVPATPARPPVGAGPSLREYRDRLLRDPQQLNELVQIRPRNQGGRFLGYEIRPGRDAALFDRLGLAPGDIVTTVNGIALDTPAKALNVLRTLAEAEEIRVGIERNGVPQSLVISLRR